ncbi:MAG: NADH-quinone oxidoreductase subunit J [Dehalococcoidia bacterium]
MVALVFAGASAVILTGALVVIMVPSIFVAALGLVVSLSGIAVIYVLLDADFLAAAQFMIYVGGISVLILFAVMLTGQINRASTINRLMPLAILISLVSFFGIAYAITRQGWSFLEPKEVLLPMVGSSSREGRYLADILFTDFLLPFELAGILLLVATVAALVIARER